MVEAVTVILNAAIVMLPLTVFSPAPAIAGRAGGGDSPQSFTASQSGAPEAADHPVDNEPSQGDKVNISRSPARSSRAVCVKLCDGSFFPLNVSEGAGNEASCARQCPGALTEVFFMMAGSDRIDDATSGGGQRYSALPGAFHYRSAVARDCTCGAPGARDSANELLGDPTLRKGDLVMTANGVRMFRGASNASHRSDDFIGLSQSALPRAERDELTAMEREATRSDAAVLGETAPKY
jgi:Protein of unknown function (DUF2865)